MKPAKVKPLTEKDLAALSKLHTAALTPQLLDTAVEQAHISRTTLEVFGIGYSSEFGRYTFPMFDGTQKLVGFAMWGGKRDGVWNTKTGMIPGSRIGLFLPMPIEVVDCPLIDRPQTLVMPQGPIDAAFVRDVGFMGVIGRPTCSSCVGDAATLLAGLPPQEVIVILPGGPGTPGYYEAASGALAMMEQLVKQPDARVRLWRPPAGKSFRDLITDFAGMALAVLTSTVMTPKRMEAARWQLKQMQKQMQKGKAA